MPTLVMLLIGRHKAANLYLFKSYSTIIESICECFIFYNREKDPTYSTFTCITKNIQQLQNQYLNVLFFITNREKK